MEFTVSITSATGTEIIKVPEGYHIQPIDFFVDQCHEAEKSTVLILLKDDVVIDYYINY